MGRKLMDRTGCRYGRLTVIGFDGKSSWGESMWRCQCDCGGEVSASGSNLTSGNVRSCKCLSRDTHTTHGASSKKSGDLELRRTYQVWTRMLRRCYNPNHDTYKYYGGRGISVCDRWRNSFPSFLEDMGVAPKGLTIDRKDNDGNYCKENCRWATRLEQMNNTSRSVRLETVEGLPTISEAARGSGVKMHTVYARLKRGHDPKAALLPIDFRTGRTLQREAFE